jgi:hypothetical protein
MRRESICFCLTIAIGLFCLMVAVVTSPAVLAVFQLDAVLTSVELQDPDLRKRVSAVLVTSNGRQNIFWGLVGMANIGVGAFGLRGRRKAEIRYSA